ncbi:MAG: hypothetical protein HQL43_02300 [Alphaproteobacteria bacterium]|nr:hypothetical protein [Alphaproteobacteria bacterium]
MKQICLMFILGLLAASEAAAGESVQVSRQDCQRLVRHVPSADVAYKPGVDAKGRPVKPADLGAESGDAPLVIELPDSFEFSLDKKPVTSQVGLSDSSMSVGTIKIDLMSGRAYFNGKPLNKAEEADLAAQCQKQGAK